VGRRRKAVELALWMNGEHVGMWRVTSTGMHELHYDAQWIESPLGRPVSLSMPLRPASVPYKGDVVRNYFENLLPDNKAIRTRIAHRFNTTADAFDLLREIGRDCAGALQLLPESAMPENVRRVDASPMSDEAIEMELANLTNRNASRTDDQGFLRLSLAGAQEKTAFTWHDGQWCRPAGATPTTHIFKLPLGQVPSGIDLTTSVYNEWLCAHLLAALGVPVASTTIGRFGAQQVLIVERFDRRMSSEGWWLRLPQEDFAQVYGVDPARKYEADGGPGIASILRQLHGSSQAQEDRRDFMRTQVLFRMLCAIDGHSKNFSLFIGPRGSYQLTPRYDVLSAYPVMGRKAGMLARQNVKMAMAVWGKTRHYEWARIQRRHLEHTATACHVPDGANIIDELAARTPGAIDDIAARLPNDFPAEVAESIFIGLRGAAKSLQLNQA